MKKVRFLTDPDMFKAALLFIVLIPAYVGLVWLLLGSPLIELLRAPEFPILLGGPYFVMLFILFLFRYQWAAVAEIQADRLVLRALGTHRDFLFADMHYIGIDYGIYEGKKKFWIYFSSSPVPLKFYHNMRKAKITREFARIRYRKKVYDLLCENTPSDVSDQLRKSYSVVLLYKLDEQ